MVQKAVKVARKSASSLKKPKAKPSHPPTAQVVVAAIKNLKERNGSSLQAIKKYITSAYKIDANKLAPFIKKFLKKAVASGKLIQTKGKGASGSFKLSKSSKVAKVTKVKKVKTKKEGAKKVGVKKAKAKKPKKAIGEKIKPKQKSIKPKKAVAPKKKSPKAKKLPPKKK